MVRLHRLALLGLGVAGGVAGALAAGALAGDLRADGYRISWEPSQCRAPYRPTLYGDSNANERVVEQFRTQVREFRDCVGREAQRDRIRLRRTVDQAIDDGAQKAIDDAQDDLQTLERDLARRSG